MRRESTEQGRMGNVLKAMALPLLLFVAIHSSSSVRWLTAQTDQIRSSVLEKYQSIRFVLHVTQELHSLEDGTHDSAQCQPNAQPANHS
jgi:hypothetical protein